eukprot:1159315-Pelagomonas_calceolata.AAC.6
MIEPSRPTVSQGWKGKNYIAVPAYEGSLAETLKYAMQLAKQGGGCLGVKDRSSIKRGQQPGVHPWYKGLGPEEMLLYQQIKSVGNTGEHWMPRAGGLGSNAMHSARMVGRSFDDLKHASLQSV